MDVDPRTGSLRSLLRGTRLGTPFAALVTASGVSNLLMLTGPLFMMQVYDRVLGSGSLPTLWVLTTLVAGLFACYGVFETVRSRLTSRIAEVLDDRLRGPLFALSVRARLVAGVVDRADPSRDGDVLRRFVAGPAPLALLDLPWVPVYVTAVFLLHPVLGWVTLAGAGVAVLLLVAGELLTRERLRSATEHQLRRQTLVDESRQSAESVLGMSMLTALGDRLDGVAAESRTDLLRATDRAGTVSAASRAFRFFLQSAVLATGAWLVLRGELSGGVMIASSVITSRALAPVDQVVGQWRSIDQARAAWRRVRAMLAAEPRPGTTTSLPRPTGPIELDGAAVGPPGARTPVLRQVTFSLAAGDGLAVVGPSGAGKSALARGLVGAWPVLAGEYRVDGADLAQYDPAVHAGLVGYLPQDVGLLSGTVAQNIARFATRADPGTIVAAARAAQVHDLIVRLPHGYDTPVGPSGLHLSAGQRQRIGLARALHGDPHLIVLDEPNAHLDHEGEQALTAAIRAARDGGAVVVAVVHRRGVLAGLSHVLVLADGAQSSFGPISTISAAGARQRATTAQSAS
ncbi:MAG TPA: type I secretion system permease/ATPase [Cellulomonas sp.]